MANEPTILVKQEDGTSVRMTLAEFKVWREKRMETAPQSAPATSQAAAKKAPPPIPPPDEAELPSIDTPQKHIPASKKEKSSGDEPLAGMFLPKEDTKPEPKKEKMDLANAKDEPTIADGKETKTDLKQPPKSKPGPLKPVSVMKDTEPAKAVPIQEDHVDKKPSLAEQLYRQSQIKPATKPKAPENAAPIPSMSMPPVAPKTNMRKPGVDPVTSPPLRRTVMGPVDEFAVLSLTDFRRMGSNPAEAAKRLQEKFTTLKDESYLMYLDGTEAWKHSPLYKQYQGVLVGALESGKSLQDYLSGGSELSLADMEALAELNSTLL